MRTLALLLLLLPQQINESIEVHVSEVEVVVVDSHGKPVSGLTKNDFELREGGKVREITNFYAVDRGVLLRESEAVPAPATSTAATAAEPPLPAPPTHLVVFVDQERLDLRSRNRVLASLGTFVKAHLKPGVDASIITYSHGPKVRLQPTTDGAKVFATIAEIEHESVRMNEMISERRRILQLIDDATSDIGKRPSVGMAEVKQTMGLYADAQIHDLLQTLDAIQSIMNRLRGASGRKIFVHVSTGLPLQPAVEVYDYFERRLKTSLSLDKIALQQISAYDRLVASAQAAGVALYTIDASGLTLDEGANLTNSDANRLDSGLMRDNLRGPLQMLADETGGKAIINENDFDRAFTEIEAQYTTYYSIGFRADGDKALHKIGVLVKRPGLTVRSARAYRERDSDERTRDAVEAAFDFPSNENPLGVDVRFGAMEPANGGVGVPISVIVAPGKLVALSDGTAKKAHVRCYYEVRNAGGGISPLRVVDEELVVADETTPVVLRKVAGMKMKPGRYTLSMAVRDLLSNDTSYVVRTIDVPAAPAPR